MSLVSSNKKIVLAIDCSSAQGSLCFFDGKDTFDISWKDEKSHAEILTDSINNSLNSFGREINDVSALILNIGPGSFTGIRIACNTAKSLSFALNLPVFTFNSLEIAANDVKKKDIDIAVAINAHSNKCYFATYHRSQLNEIKNIKPPCVLDVEMLKKINFETYICIGDGFKEYNLPVLVQESSTSFAHIMVDLYREQASQLASVNWQDIEPLYIRVSSPEEKLLLDLGHKQKKS